MKVTVIYHYDVDDDNCSGDYRTVDVFFDKRLIVEYQDHYHDHSQDRVEGIEDCLKALEVEYEMVTKHVNDY